MSKPKSKSTVKGVQAPAALTKESRVIREEQTYTTTRKKWQIIWLPAVHEKQGTRTVEVKKAVAIDLERYVEFFPSKFLKGLNLKLLGRDKGEVTLEALEAFMEAYVETTRHVNVMHYERRPRPQSQIELEEELATAYEELRTDKSVIAQQDEELTKLRAQIKLMQAQGSKP